MVVGISVFELHLPAARSLKEKRQVVKSLVERIAARHRVCVLESDFQDLHQRSEITLALLGHTPARGRPRARAHPRRRSRSTAAATSPTGSRSSWRRSDEPPHRARRRPARARAQRSAPARGPRPARPPRHRLARRRLAPTCITPARWSRFSAAKTSARRASRRSAARADSSAPSWAPACDCAPRPSSRSSSTAGPSTA